MHGSTGTPPPFRWDNKCVVWCKVYVNISPLSLWIPFTIGFAFVWMTSVSGNLFRRKSSHCASCTSDIRLCSRRASGSRVRWFQPPKKVWTRVIYSRDECLRCWTIHLFSVWGRGVGVIESIPRHTVFGRKVKITFNGYWILCSRWMTNLDL